MKTIKLNKKEAESIFDSLSGHYKIIAPTEKPGRGRFSDTNLITYDEVGSLCEIDFYRETYFSAKAALFPIREKIFEFRDRRMDEPNEPVSPTIIFLRSCDINAIKVMDAHFLKNGDFEDIYYKRRREKMKFFLIECEKPFNNCFCVSMGTNTTENYSVFMRKTKDGYEAEVKDSEFEKYFSAGKELDVKPRFVEKDLNPVNLPQEIDVSLFEHKIWKEYSLRCTACGRCNTSCPTCACFSIQDINSEDIEKKKTTRERKRIWSSCQVKNFGLLAGNQIFNSSKRGGCF